MSYPLVRRPATPDREAPGHDPCAIKDDLSHGRIESEHQGPTHCPGLSRRLGAARLLDCFSARAYDRVGNLGARSNERCTTTPIDDRALRASSGWGHAKDAAPAGTDVARLRQRPGHPRWPQPRCLRPDVTPHPEKQVIVLRRYHGLRDGAIVVRVVSSGQSVQIDGFIASR